MRIKPREYKLQDGKILTVRSVEGEDAAAYAACRQKTYRETYFLARYPEESEADLEKMRVGLAKCAESPLNFEVGAFCAESPLNFEVGAFCGEEVVGALGVSQVRPHLKYRHRAMMGISLLKEYWGCGLGSFLMQIAVEQAATNGFEQLELGVFEDNARAIALYEKFGFEKYGVSPRAFKLKDGTYRDEIIMVRMLK